jgi:hypothetical protein
MIFLFGDLNYRIELPNDVVRPSVKKQEWALLKQHDELIAAFRKYGDPNEALPNLGGAEIQYQFYKDFMEGNIEFQPTYKYDKRT